MTTKNRVFRLVLSLVLTVLSLVVVSAPSASALELDFDVQSYWAGGAPSSVEWVSSNDPLTTGQFVCAGGTDYRSQYYGINIVLDSNMASSVRTGDVFELNLSATADNNSNVNIDFVTALYDYDGHFDILDVSYEMAGQGASRLKFILMARSNGVYSLKIRRVGGGNFFSMSRASGWECMTAGNWVAYHPKGSDAQAIVNAINSNNSTSAINDAKREIVGAIEEQQQTQQDIHDDEKDTIQDSVDEAENTADGMSFGFNLANHFLNWFALFNDNACVSIPTLHDWLNSTDTQVCSPWRNTNVRSVLTPIFALLGTMLVTGFVLRWLSRNNTEGTIEGI